MIQASAKIQESSSNMMAFLVDDLLDFAQLNAGKFRKVIKQCLLNNLQQIMSKRSIASNKYPRSRQQVYKWWLEWWLQCQL